MMQVVKVPQDTALHVYSIIGLCYHIIFRYHIFASFYYMITLHYIIYHIIASHNYILLFYYIIVLITLYYCII